MSEGTIGEAGESEADRHAREALRRELAGQVVVHSLLYLGMVLLPAIALIWARTQGERWLGIGLAAALMGLLVTPVANRWRLAILAALIVGAVVVRVVVLG